MLRSSSLRIDYLLQHCPPEDTQDISEQFDALMTRLTSDIAGSDLSTVPYAIDRLKIPIKHNGLGIRSRAELAPAAYVGAAAKAIPYLTRSLPTGGTQHTPAGKFDTTAVALQIGRDSFTGTSHATGDWSQLYSSGGQTGIAVRTSWQRLQREHTTTTGTAPTTGPLAANEADIGDGFSNLQHAISEARDEAARDQLEARMHAGSRELHLFTSGDRLSRAFLITTGRHPYGLNPYEFMACFARYIGAPQPICRAHVGQNLVVNARGGAVDQH